MNKRKNYKGASSALIIVLALVAVGVLVLLYLVGQYNSLVRLENQVEKQQANIEAVLQRRYDLIPNLVNSVEGVFDQEEDIAEKVTEARKEYVNAPSGSNEKIEAAEALETQLSQFLVVVESYPEIRSTETVQNLMDELAGSENRISTERRRYNEDATAYNTKIRTFPTNLIASLFGFEEKPLFEAEEGAEEVPEVDLTD